MHTAAYLSEDKIQASVLSYPGSENQTQAIGLGWQGLLPTEPSHKPLHLAFFILLRDVTSLLWVH